LFIVELCLFKVVVLLSYDNEFHCDTTTKSIVIGQAKVMFNHKI